MFSIEFQIFIKILSIHCTICIYNYLVHCIIKGYDDVFCFSYKCLFSSFPLVYWENIKLYYSPEKDIEPTGHMLLRGGQVKLHLSIHKFVIEVLLIFKFLLLQPLMICIPGAIS